MKVYQLDRDGIYLSTTTADPNPLEPGEFLIPGGCVTIEPPTIPQGKLAWFVDGKWSLIDPPAPGEEPALPTIKGAKVTKTAQVDQWLLDQTATLEWDGNIYQTDAIAKNRLQGELTMAQADIRPDPAPWRTLSNDMVSLSNKDLIALATAVWQAQQVAIFASFAHKDAIASLKTIKAVERYEIK